MVVLVSALGRQERCSSRQSDPKELSSSFTSCGLPLARTSSDHLELNLTRLLSLQLSSNDTFKKKAALTGISDILALLCARETPVGQSDGVSVLHLSSTSAVDSQLPGNKQLFFAYSHGFSVFGRGYLFI